MVRLLMERRQRPAWLQRDARWRPATTGDATTSWRTRGKREERHQRTRGDGALIGRGCELRGGGRVKRTRGGGIDATTSRQMRAVAKATVMAMATTPANERQMGGEAPADKRRRGLDRPRLRVERRRQSFQGVGSGGLGGGRNIMGAP